MNPKKIEAMRKHGIDPFPPYEQVVIRLIRQKYSVDDEFAILRQRDTKLDEFNEYNTYAEECKAKAKQIVSEYPVEE